MCECSNSITKRASTGAGETTSKEPARKKIISMRVAEQIVAHIIGRIKEDRKDKVEALGGFVRRKPYLKDIDIITNVTLDIAAYRIGLTEKYSPARRKIHFFFKGVHIDVFYVKNEEWPYAQMHYTGDQQFNLIIRAHAKKLGYRLNQYGLFDSETGKRVKGTENLKTERQVFKFLNFKWHYPFERVFKTETRPKKIVKRMVLPQ